MRACCSLICALVLAGCSCSQSSAHDAGLADASLLDAALPDAGQMLDAGQDAAADAGVDSAVPDGGPPGTDSGFVVPPPRALTCDEAATRRSYIGCDYWPTATPNAVDQSQFHFAVSVANPDLSDANIHISGGALDAPRDFTVAPGETHTEILPWVDYLSGGTPGLIVGGAYHLTSDLPVVVYQFSPLEFTVGMGSDQYSYSNDASLLLPSTALGSTYRALLWPTDSGNAGGTITLVATASGTTTINVHLTQDSRPYYAGGSWPTAAGSIATIELSQGDAFLIETGYNLDGLACGLLPDLTGTAIDGDQDFAVFGGHECTFVPCGTAYCDHLEEQLFPLRTWGRSYVVSALRERGDGEPSVIRILSDVDDNMLSFDGITAPTECPAMLDAGEFCQFQTADDFVVSGTSPILIAQYMVGQDIISGTSGGDPAMVLEVPTFQFRTDYVISVPETYVENFLTIVHRIGVPPVIDGFAIPAGTPVGTSPYAVTRFAVTPGTHRLDGVAFGIKVSGVAPYTSYLYPGGLDLSDNF